jgi:hypothetical protein
LPFSGLCGVDAAVLTPVTMKSQVFWDTTPCSPVKINQRFRRIYRLHVQVRSLSQARNKHKRGRKHRVISPKSAFFIRIIFATDNYLTPYSKIVVYRNVCRLQCVLPISVEPPIIMPKPALMCTCIRRLLNPLTAVISTSRQIPN